MTGPARPPLLLVPLIGMALLTAGCGLPRHVEPRPDYDLPQGFSGTYRFGLVLAGEVPAGPTDREALARLDRRPVPPPAAPFPGASVQTSPEAADAAVPLFGAKPALTPPEGTEDATAEDATPAAEPPAETSAPDQAPAETAEDALAGPVAAAAGRVADRLRV